MAHHFFIADLAGSLLGCALFSLFAFVPGYVLAWTLQLLDFRRRTLLAQLTLSIPFSIGVSPALAYLLARFLSMAAVWIGFGFIWAAFLAIAAAKFRIYAKRLPARRTVLVCASIAGAWLLIGLISLVDIQIRSRLYFSVVSFDYTLRTALVASISRTGIPPANPYFHPGHAIPLRYHYFWLIPCSLVNILGGALVSARNAIIGGTLWVGLGLIAIVPLFLRFVHPAGARNIYRRSMVGIALLTVTGLDIVPNLLLDLAKMPLPDPEWWNNQVSSWTTSVLWVPHHTAALIAGLAAVLLIWNSSLAAGAWRRAGWMAGTGLCLATCAGSSIYVGAVFAAALLVWTCMVFWKRWHREGLFLLGAGLLSMLAIARHVVDLQGSLSGAAGAGPVFVLWVRDFSFSGVLSGWTHSSAVRIALVNALMLPLNYFLELGAFFVGGIWTVRLWFSRGAKLDRYRMAMLALAAPSILICTFLRSSVIANNDLGGRGFLLGQFVLLLCLVDLLEPGSSLTTPRRAFLGLLLMTGVAGSLYEAATLRAYPFLSDALDIPRYEWLSRDHNLGSRTYALREGYEELKSALPPGAIVQHNPDGIPGDLPYGLYADRPVAAETPECGVVFGGDPQACAVVLSRLRPIFDGTADGEAVDHACTALSISALLVKDTDPAWAHRESWVWQRPSMAANRFMRVLSCGASGREAAKQRSVAALDREAGR